MNSSTILEKLKALSGGASQRPEIDIVLLGKILKINTSSLVSLLTELEHRDEIVLDITHSVDPATQLQTYSGTVKLMKTPPDELHSIPGEDNF